MLLVSRDSFRLPTTLIPARLTGRDTPRRRCLGRPSADWSDLAAVGDGGGDLGDRLVDRHPVLLRPVAVAERDRSGGAVVIPRDEHVGHLGLARVADLLREAVVAGVELGADAVGAHR